MIWSDYAITSVQMWRWPFQSFYLDQFTVLPSNMAPLLSIKHSKNRKKIKNRLCGMSQMSINPTTDLFCCVSLHSLEEGRQQQIAIQTFKIVNNFSPPYLRGLITPQKFTRIHRNYVKTLEIPFYNSVRHGTNSFSFFGTWNNLQGGNSYTIWSSFFQESHSYWSVHNSRLELFCHHWDNNWNRHYPFTLIHINPRWPPKAVMVSPHKTTRIPL